MDVVGEHVVHAVDVPADHHEGRDLGQSVENGQGADVSGMENELGGMVGYPFQRVSVGFAVGVGHHGHSIRPGRPHLHLSMDHTLHNFLPIGHRISPNQTPSCPPFTANYGLGEGP
jgi:hypothetical protein